MSTIIKDTGEEKNSVGEPGKETAKIPAGILPADIKNRWLAELTELHNHANKTGLELHELHQFLTDQFGSRYSGDEEAVKCHDMGVTYTNMVASKSSMAGVYLDMEGAKTKEIASELMHFHEWLVNHEGVAGRERTEAMKEWSKNLAQNLLPAAQDSGDTMVANAWSDRIIRAPQPGDFPSRPELIEYERGKLGEFIEKHRGELPADEQKILDAKFARVSDHLNTLGTLTGHISEMHNTFKIVRGQGIG